MLSLLSNAYSTAINHYAPPENKATPLTKELRRLLQNPELTREEKEQLFDQIALIEGTQAQNQLKRDLCLTSYAVSSVIGGFFGPVGTGIVELSSSAPRRQVEKEQGARIRKARVVGGQRRKPPKKPHKASQAPSSKQPDMTSVSSALTCVTLSLLSIPLINEAKSMAGSSWSYLNS